MERTILNTLRAMDTSDGAGVRLKRKIRLQNIVCRPGPVSYTHLTRPTTSSV